MRPASRVVDRFRPGPFVFAPIAQSETWRRASSPTPRQSGGGGGDPEQRLHFRRAVLPGSAISVGTTLVVVDDWTRFDQRGGVRVVAAEATGASRCSLKVVLVLAAGGVDRVRFQVGARVEVADQPVPQILGGQLRQRC